MMKQNGQTIYSKKNKVNLKKKTKKLISGAQKS